MSANAPDPGRRASTGEKAERGAHTAPDFSHIDQRRVLRKMDLRLIPMLALLYLLSFLDRGNIGNANIQGMSDELKLQGPQYNLCLTVFFFTYAAFELPSNLMLKRLRPSIWLPSIMIAWGIVTTLTGLVKDYRGLLIARVFLGVAEAGLYPGVAYYITMWYRRDQAQYRQALFFSAASVAGAFSGLLAFAIAKMNNVGGLSGWRWIFILEGLLTVAVAIFAFFALYDFPETASFLTEDERAWVIHGLKYQGSTDSNRQVAESDNFQWRYVMAAATDWQLYAAILMYWGIVVPLYSISFFLPSIINQLGYQASTAQLLTIPIYIFAAVLAVVMGYLSDKHNNRSWFVFGAMCLIATGFVIAIAGSGAGNGRVPGLVYAGVFIATAGIYPAFPGNITWLSNNLAGSYKRAAGMALHIGLGNLGGAIASNIYRKEDQPKYILGHALVIGFTVAGLAAVLFMRVNYKRLNRKRDGLEMGAGHDSRYSDKEMSELGDRAPTYRYAL